VAPGPVFHSLCFLAKMCYCQSALVWPA